MRYIQGTLIQRLVTSIYHNSQLCFQRIPKFLNREPLKIFLMIPECKIKISSFGFPLISSQRCNSGKIAQETIQIIPILITHLILLWHTLHRFYQNSGLKLGNPVITRLYKVSIITIFTDTFVDFFLGRSEEHSY